MPEGDTVHRQCRLLDETLAGGVLDLADLRVPRLATRDLVGWRVADVRPHGKHLLIHLEDPAGQREPLTLHTHLMMEGIWQTDRWEPGGAARGWIRPGHLARVILEAEHPGGERGRAVAFEVQQVRLVRTAEDEDLVGHLGPDLLDPDWDDALADRAAANLVSDPERPVGLALLDQRNLAGVGNIYRSELCFLQRVHPLLPVGELEDPRAMVDLARRLLWVNRDRTVRMTTGGMMGRDGDLWVYGRASSPCRRCRARIQRSEIPEPAMPETEPRVIYTCPRCQRGGPSPDPADHGGRTGRHRARPR